METQSELMSRLEEVQSKIDKTQAKFDSKKFKTYGGAYVLQTLRAERKAILAQIEPVKLVWTHPFPDTLPEPCKRSRNDVRAFMGLDPIEGGDTCEW
jgi:hypothetical protein